MTQEIVSTIWSEKYRFGDEASPAESKTRVATAVFAKDPRRDEFLAAAIDMMVRDEFSPGGRIHAGAGTGRSVTLQNCYASETIEDSMVGIMRANTNAALTMQQGGGIGMDFSTLRPKGAVVKGVGSVSSGPMSFMGLWNSMCETIMSGGSRRGAMMATMAVDHPDIEAFITAKMAAGQLTNFNMSVLVTDAFMDAVKNDLDWDLGFGIPPAKLMPVHVEKHGAPWYIYRRMKARALWELITKTTFEYAEPGVIFIDQVNENNNLSYCENISTTNPCAEQPLPPNGACNLGCINLAKLIRSPFTPAAKVDVSRLTTVVALAVRFLDNVLDVTNFPLPEQAEESRTKRRIGLGIMGLGNALQMLGLRYGSKEAAHATEDIVRTLAFAAYRASAELAKERGSFPMFSKDHFIKQPFVRRLSPGIRAEIYDHGIRNGVLLTIAPTGTTAIYAGNVSSGLEPTFAWRYFRKVLQPDGTHREFAVVDAGFVAFCQYHGLDPATAPTDNLPGYMVTALELTVDEHLRMQAACQKYIDASISKTINVPTETSYEDFQAVYLKAYGLGCKGCTTYRPSGVRGSVLSLTSDAAVPATAAKTDVVAMADAAVHRESEPPPVRPDVLNSKTYKIKWPYSEDSLYVTISDKEEHGSIRPFEIFVASRSVAHAELLSGLTILISAILRRREHPLFIVQDLEKVQSAQGAWVNGRYIPGVVALIAGVLRRHLESLGMIEGDRHPPVPVPASAGAEKAAAHMGEPCPKCNAPALVHTDGCKKCLACSYSACG